MSKDIKCPTCGGDLAIAWQEIAYNHAFANKEGVIDWDNIVYDDCVEAVEDSYHLYCEHCNLIDDDLLTDKFKIVYEPNGLPSGIEKK